LPNEHRRLAARSDDEDRLLEARVESGEVRDVGAVLAIGVDDEPVVAALLRTHPKTIEARGVESRWHLRHRVGHAEVREVDASEPCHVTRR
jgi:hypothetical protein